ncbi:glycosyltransferase family 4 protein [PVC group bacterium]|nr:glycosyltransferase family 4 protein [PVC group bacterium]
MSKSIKRSIAFLGNYLPRKCGIATFTKDICEAVSKEVSKNCNVYAIAMTNRSEGYDYPERVKFDIRDQIVSDYEKAADLVNTSKVDVVCVQHEYGIYGGEWGEYLHVFLRQVKVPVVTTLHTVLEKSMDETHEKVFRELIARSDRLIVLAEKAIPMLKNRGVPEEKLIYIPHGIPDFSRSDSKKFKENLDLSGKTMILTFGLLGPDKGIEYMIEAMGALVERYPDLVYIVLGATHPEIIKHYGEEYRHKLMRQIESLGLQKHVFLYDRFVELEELCEYIHAADFYVIPYLNREQIVSGTLCYALGAGKAVISTPSLCAEELLRDQRGVLVPFKNANALAKALENLFQDADACEVMRDKSYKFGMKMRWPNVAKEYLDVFRSVQKERPLIVSERKKAKEPILLSSKFPFPKLDHIMTLTDDFAMLQHARYTIPNYDHGYCVDDNARAIVVATKFYRIFNEGSALSLLNKYLAFVFYAQREDGLFRNFYDMRKQPLDEIGSDDCQGRCLWGLGYVMAYGPARFGMAAKSCFKKVLPHTQKFEIRGIAFSILGLYYYLLRFPDDEQIKSLMTILAESLVRSYQETSDEKWFWFENSLTYANGLLPVALWVASYSLKQKKYQDVAQKATVFLRQQSVRNGHLSLIGCKGWHSKENQKKAQYDQQAIDALWMVELSKFAYRYTNDENYLSLMKTSVDWFLGENDLSVALYDRVTGGCYDGLTSRGANLNQGAESTLSAVIALLSIAEMAYQQSEMK